MPLYVSRHLARLVLRLYAPAKSSARQPASDLSELLPTTYGLLDEMPTANMSPLILRREAKRLFELRR